MNVAVTGGGGYIGSELVKTLDIGGETFNVGGETLTVNQVAKIVVDEVKAETGRTPRYPIFHP
jgi:nucleoside-diphosphate-sugar epimerase